MTALLLFAMHMTQAAPRTFHDFSARAGTTGEETPLRTFKGKTLLVVNTASECGFTHHYKGLQELQDRYGTQGFTVLGFPSNDFGGQEPGSDAEIKKFCELNYKVSFPLFSKGPVGGDGAPAVFKWLTEEADPHQSGPIRWNFEKFLIDRDGRLIKRFRSTVKPTDELLVREIEKLLAR